MRTLPAWQALEVAAEILRDFISGAVSVKHKAGGDPQYVLLAIYDISGRPICDLVSEPQEAGYYEVTWDGWDAQGRPVGTRIYAVGWKRGVISFSVGNDTIL